MIVCVQIEQQNIITGWEGGRRPCEQGLKGKGGGKKIWACVCHRENKSQRSAGVIAYVGRVPRSCRGKIDMGKRGKKKKAIWLGQIFGKRRKKITRRRIPLLRNRPHWIERLAHAVGDSAVWERRHRKQDRSASVPKIWCCGLRIRWKKNPTSVSVWRCVRPGIE